jgi:hypothetical protein
LDVGGFAPAGVPRSVGIVNKLLVAGTGIAVLALAAAGIAVNAATLSFVPEGDIGQAPGLIMPTGSPTPAPSVTPSPSPSSDDHGGVAEPGDDHGGGSNSGPGGSDDGGGDDQGGSGGGHGSDD